MIDTAFCLCCGDLFEWRPPQDTPEQIDNPDPMDTPALCEFCEDDPDLFDWDDLS